MADPDRPLFDEIGQDIAQLRAELGEMLELRWKLAQLELHATLGAIKRLAGATAVVAVMLLTALPLAAVVGADFLEKISPITKTGWLIGFTLSLIAGAILIGWTAWRSFRRTCTGFEETLEELHEDVAWIREMTEGRPTDRQDPDE